LRTSMKYKVGDRVILRKATSFFHDDVCRDLERLPNREATIYRIIKTSAQVRYYMNEIGYQWFEEEIEDLAKEKKCLPIQVITRFDLMDFSDEY
jgi:hypothetical protein